MTKETTEVLVIISPFPGGDETAFRVTLLRPQLRDVLEKEDYCREVFEAFRETVCAALGYKTDASVMNVILPENADTYIPDGVIGSRPDVGMKTGDVVDGSLLLH